jgi:6-phosphogluconolactonase (cycloisomerase 2 family)
MLAFLASPILASPAAAAESPVLGHAYINDNTTPGNTIAAFDRHADGTLTPVAGSPFSTGGGGSGASIGSQGAVQLSSDGRYLLAVDPGSNQVSVLRVAFDGSLTPVPNGVVSSGGIEPVSIAVHDDLVYVANAGSGGSNYTGFRLHNDGQLSPLAHSTFPLPDGSQPGDVLFDPTGTHLVGTRVGTSLIDSFGITADGRLAPAAGSPVAAQGPGPFGSEFSPTNPARLYVSNAHGGTDNGTVSSFHVSSSGKLDSIGASPFPDHQTAPCWIEISHDGRYLFTVNTASASISRYAIGGSGQLRLLGSTLMRGGTSLSPFDARLNPQGNMLFVVDSEAAAVSAFAVNGGHLAEVRSSPTALPAGAAPFGIAIN